MLIDFASFLLLYPHGHCKTKVTVSDVFRIVGIHVLFFKPNDKNKVERHSRVYSQLL